MYGHRITKLLGATTIRASKAIYSGAVVKNIHRGSERTASARSQIAALPIKVFKLTATISLQHHIPDLDLWRIPATR